MKPLIREALQTLSVVYMELCKQSRKANGAAVDFAELTNIDLYE